MSDLDEAAVVEHYERAREVYEALATVDDHPTLAVYENSGWYITRDTDDLDALEAGYPKRRRPISMERDLDHALDQLDRTLYALTTYKTEDAIGRWRHARYGEDGTEWWDDNAMPEERHLRCVAAWGDIDLVNDLKSARGSLDRETRETVEEALAAYAEEYADLYGTADAVYGLDSVGGAYLFGPPEATLPIVEAFSDDEAARTRILAEVIERTNDYLTDAEDRVNDRVPGASELLDPDWVNNKNRQYKAPLAIHQSQNGVVTPLDPSAPDYRLTELEDVDESTVAEGREWAERFTAREHEECVAHLVEKLWPHYTEKEETWEAALRAWVEQQREHEAALERADEDGDGTPTSVVDVGDASLTTDARDVSRAVDAIDAQAAAEKFIVAAWNDEAGTSDGNRAFYPEWAPNCNGTANIVNDTVWTDTGKTRGGEHPKGGPVEIALTGPTDDWRRGEDAAEDDWWRGVNKLREHFEIPVYTPDATSTKADGTEYEQMPFWSVRKAAVALGVLDAEDFVEREGDDGGTYLGFPDGETYSAALEAIEDAGLQHNRTTEAEQRARETLTEVGEEYADADGEDAEDDVVSGRYVEIHEALGEASSEVYLQYRSEAAEWLDTSTDRLDTHRALYQHEQESGAHYSHNGETGIITGSLRRRKPLLNFEIDVDSFLKLPAPEDRLLVNLEVEPSNDAEPPFEKQIEPEVFNEPRRFRDALLSERFSTEIVDDEMDERDVVKRVREYIAAQDVPHRSGTKQMGLFNGDFVTPNGVIGPDGWTDDAESVFVERGTGAEREFTLSPEDSEDYDTDSVADMLELLVQTRDPERFLPVLGWYYAAPFRPLIVNEAGEGEFNLLHVTGQSGTGKTTTLRLLSRFFGMSGEPFSCTGTSFPIMTALASSNAVPMWMDEYKPAELSEWMQSNLHQLLRKAATGGIEQRGNADQTTEEYHLNAPAVISGEEGLLGSAENRRAVSTVFRQKPTEAGTEYAQNLHRLLGDAVHTDDGVEFSSTRYDFTEHALAYYSRVTATDTEEFLGQWRKAKRYVEERLSEWDGAKADDDLEKQGLQTVVFGYWQLRDFAEDLDADLAALPTEEDLDAALKRLADVDGPGRVTHLDEYVQLLGRVALEGDLERGTHYTVVREGEPDEEIRVNVDRAHDRVSKYARDHDLTMDLLGQARDYKTRFKEAANEPGGFVVNYSQKSPPINRAIGIDPDAARQQLEEFSWPDLVEDTEDKTDGEDAAEGALADAATELAKTGEHPGYPSVTVEVLSTEYPAGDGPALRAVCRDKSGAFDVIHWEDEDALDEGQCYLLQSVDPGYHHGSLQLVMRDGVTNVREIEPGEGHTVLDSDAEAGAQPAATDGGGTDAEPQPTAMDDYETEGPSPGAPEPSTDPDEIADTTGRLREHVRVNVDHNEVVSEAQLAGALDIPPDEVSAAVEALCADGTLQREPDKGYRKT